MTKHAIRQKSVPFQPSIHSKIGPESIWRLVARLLGLGRTVAALGDRGRGGLNDEACLYRRVPAEYLLTALGLAQAADGPGVAPSDLPPFDPGEAIPLGAEASRDPGSFERLYGRVAWWPPSKEMAYAVSSGLAKLELVDKDRAPTPSLLEAVVGFNLDDQPRWLNLDPGSQRSAFGRVHFLNGMATRFAVVASVDELRAETRERPNPRAERAEWMLETETEEGLWLLEALAALEEPSEGERLVEPAKARQNRQSHNRRESNIDGGGAVLDYATFMVGRRRRISAVEAERNSLAGSGVSLVRGFLNRVIGLGADTVAPDAAQRALETSALDIGDEVGDGEAAMEAGLDLGSVAQRPTYNAKAEHRHREAEAGAIALAVEMFGRRFRESPSDRLSTKDLLRLRALLTVIVVAGWNGPGPQASKPTLVQVLPIHDGNRMDTWPRLIGRALAVFFSGPNPAIARLSMDRIHDRLPDDVLECLACCRWVAGAALDAVLFTAPRSELAKIMAQLVAKVLALADLSPEELAAPATNGVIEGMGKRFSQRLGSVESATAARGGDRRAARRLKKVAHQFV